MLAALVLALAASCSYGAGLVTWLVGLGVLSWRAGRSGSGAARAVCVLWMAVSVLFLRAYFAGNTAFWAAGETGQDLGGLIGHLLRIVASPVCYRWPRWSGPAGVALLTLFGGMAWLAHRKGGAAPSSFRFAFLLGLTSVGISLLTAAGRYRFGIEQAFESRYLAFSSLLLIAIIFMASDLMKIARASGRNAGSRLARVSCALIPVFLLTAFSLNTTVRMKEGLKQSGRLQRAREELLSATPDYAKIGVYPNPESLRIMVGMLKRWGISVFRSSAP